MPVSIKKIDGYRVSTPGGTKAKSTTKVKAESQRRLLYGIESGKWKPTGKIAAYKRVKKRRKSKGMVSYSVGDGSTQISKLKIKKKKKRTQVSQSPGYGGVPYPMREKG